MAGPNPGQITLDEFQEALARYDQIVEAVSISKGAKSGQKTLAELDVYRYAEAPARFATAAKKPGRSTMQLQDVQTLVEWKLKHGKFRPTLMKLVSSNEESFVEETVKESLEVYDKTSSASEAVDILTGLKGIGPATASLLLAVHDPDNVIFFADEAFYWLCNNGSKGPIKYNTKEYKELSQKAQDLATRLNVKAVDIERVAYALMNQDAPVATTKPAKKSSVKVESKHKTAPSKRKQVTDQDENAGLRRSKRGKAT